MNTRLRDIERDDLPTLYNFQSDAEANRMALIQPRGADAFDAHWEIVLSDPSVVVKAIVIGDVLAGSISCFKSDNRDAIGYWIGREFWGQGVATQASRLLLNEVSIRPLLARVAVSNRASLRVLEKCGFKIVGVQHFPGDERFDACEEAMLELAEDQHA